MEVVVPGLPLQPNNKNHRSNINPSNNTSQPRLSKRTTTRTNPRPSNPFKWRTYSRGRSQVYRRGKQLQSHQWPAGSPTTSLCHRGDPRAAVPDADHPSIPQPHPWKAFTTLRSHSPWSSPTARTR